MLEEKTHVFLLNKEHLRVLRTSFSGPFDLSSLYDEFKFSRKKGEQKKRARKGAVRAHFTSSPGSVSITGVSTAGGFAMTGTIASSALSFASAFSTSTFSRASNGWIFAFAAATRRPTQLVRLPSGHGDGGVGRRPLGSGGLIFGDALAVHRVARSSLQWT
jgi:hypothetical protein